MNEEQFTRQVIQLAQLRGWRTLHIRPARTAGGWRTPVQGDGKGFPDLLMIRGHSVIAAELKVGKGKLTPEQDRWLSDLENAGVTVFRWTERDWPEIETVLSGRATAPTPNGEA